MEELFADYKTSLELKNIGFDEECLTYYIPNGKRIDLILESNLFSFKKYNSDKNTIYNNGIISCPLKTQVFKFFRDVYNLGFFIHKSPTSAKRKWKYAISDLEKRNIDFIRSIDFITYEEAENKCIERMIEIIKNKQNGI